MLIFIIAALIKKSITRKLIFYPDIELFSPEYVFEEIRKHSFEITTKAKVTSRQFEIILTLLMEKINIIPKSYYISEFQRAEEIIGHIDRKDIPYFALALALNADGIWSLDRHLKRQNKIKKFYTTSDLIEAFSQLL